MMKNCFIKIYAEPNAEICDAVFSNGEYTVEIQELASVDSSGTDFVEAIEINGKEIPDRTVLNFVSGFVYDGSTDAPMKAYYAVSYTPSKQDSQSEKIDAPCEYLGKYKFDSENGFVKAGD